MSVATRMIVFRIGVPSGFDVADESR